MQVVVQKWGNSLGVRIPSLYVKEFELKSGNHVDIHEENGKIVIIPQKKTLADLLAKITEENRHESVDTGTPVGKEEW